MEGEWREEAAPPGEEAVLKALNNPKYKWRTIRGIAKETNLDTATVLNVFEQSDSEIVRSSRPSKRGDELFATREHFTDQASPLE
jgi:hypothetical protein